MPLVTIHSLFDPLLELPALPEVSWFPGEILAFQPPPRLTVSEWAEERRILQAGISRRPGPWKNSVTPYLRAPMDAYNDPDIRHVVLCFGTQLGKTEALFNMLGYIIDLEPYSTLLVYPTEANAKQVSRTRIKPTIDACPSLRAKKPAEADLLATLEMHFTGMPLYIVGSNSAADLAQKPCRNVLRDEIDKYPPYLGADADPLSLSEERAKSFWDIRKIVDVSSPTLQETGIWRQLNACEAVYHYHVPCPGCGAMQRFVMPQLHWNTDGTGPARYLRVRESAFYECASCGMHITSQHKPGMVARGSWVLQAECNHPPASAAFHLSSFYSPWLTFGDMAEAFVRANDKRKEEGTLFPLQNFINGWLAEPWIQKAQQRLEEAILEKRWDGRDGRPMLPPATVPRECVALTAGIDMQKFGFWYTVYAWTHDMRSWLIDSGFLPEWEDVDRLCFGNQYPVQGEGYTMEIWRAALDTGGGEGSEAWTRTEEAYRWLRKYGGGRIFGIRGDPHEKLGGQRIRATVLDKLGKKPIRGGLTIYILSTNELKDAFFENLDNDRIFLHAEASPEFVRHILAEEKQLDRSGKWTWQPVRKANHLLDASIYAHACADPQWSGGVQVFRPYQQEARRNAPARREARW
jgi:phage terminase large subunit GpA-like protein